MLRRLIVSPPFGNIIKLSYATSVCGTYTLDARAWMFYRYFKTLRPVVNHGKFGWVNAIGLRNPGLRFLTKDRADDRVISIAVLSAFEVPQLLSIIRQFVLEKHYRIVALEINVSCPNAEVLLLDGCYLQELLAMGLRVIVKVPPSWRYLEVIEYYQKYGVKYFHLFNSFPTKRGGVSGEVITDYYLRLLRRVSVIFGDTIEIIGGGGIQSVEDVMRYQDAGARFFSISTLFFHPIKLLKFLHQYRKLQIFDDSK